MKERTKPEQKDRRRSDNLTTLIRAGARKLIAQAIETEVAQLMALSADQR